MSNLETSQIHPDKSTLDNLFKERDVVNPVENKVENKKEEKEPVENKEVEKKYKENLDKKVAEVKESPKEKVKEPEKKVIDDKDDHEEVKPYEVEVEKLKKALDDSRKWGHTNSRRLKNAVKMVNSMKEAGTLTEDEFNNLNSLLHSDADEEQEKNDGSNDAPLVKLVKIANTRLADLEEIYEDDKLFRKKVDAFDAFIENSSKEEIEDLIEELEGLENNPMKLAKRIYSITDKFYNEFYKEIDESGGMKAFAAKKNAEIEKYKKRIDKLEKELLQYKPDTPTHRIDELTQTEGLKSPPGDTIGALFKERDRVKAKGY